MKKFKFRLQSVLNVREKTFEDCQLALAQVQHKLAQQLNHLEALYRTLENTKNNLETLLSSGNIDLIMISSHQGYIEKLKADIKNQHKIISDTEVELEERKKELLEALKAKTMLEKLKEKDLKEFKANLEKLDLLQIDEMATGRYKPG